ncbi:ParB N-terminal domain-containing protein [Arthrobacter sp. FW306-07-I]|uniref:ParB N-terminal domain-containing protein n=1 Tax=Arthrobacter sp. FW306-07-I TaxID=2879622 RepID=UPI001F24F795|nr:ParB N-terminal domain-containing protein [Arthrobacter sp. FW306-07-I]UKA76177.1 hypothetical protein LFT46_03710 [Arthrobacter sp. FW306-07-I]
MVTVDLPISRLAEDSLERSRPYLDPDRVSYYLQHLDESLPVVVFDVEGVLLLADGHHRVAAAQKLGRTRVKAELRKGQRGEALQFAIDHAKEQRGISTEQVLDAIAGRGRPVQ